MKTIKWVNILLVITTLNLCLLEVKAHSQPNTETFELLNQKISNGNIRRIEILWRDPAAESRSAISPEELDKKYFQKRNLLCTQRKAKCLELGDALLRGKPTIPDLNSDPDFRWSIKFFSSKNDEPTVSIYLDGSGTNGVVNGKRSQFSKSLVNWLNANFFKIPSGSAR